jgi:hypothetical protein
MGMKLAKSWFMPRPPHLSATRLSAPAAWLLTAALLCSAPVLVQGQTNKLGAVYLYQRKSPAQPSLLARRQSFRAEIARDLLE